MIESISGREEIEIDVRQKGYLASSILFAVVRIRGFRLPFWDAHPIRRLFDRDSVKHKGGKTSQPPERKLMTTAGVEPAIS